MQVIQSANKSTLSNIYKVDRNIARLEGEMSRASEDDHPSIKSQIERLEDRKADLASKLDEQEVNFRAKQSEVKRAERAKERAATAAKDKRAQAKEGKSQQAKQDARVEEFFNERINAEAASLAVDSDDVGDMHSAVRSELIKYVNNLPPGSPTVDIKTFVEARAKAYVERQEAKAAKLLRRRTKQGKTAAAAKTTTTPAPRRQSGNGKPARDPNLNTRSGRWEAQFARDRARKFLGD